MHLESALTTGPATAPERRQDADRRRHGPAIADWRWALRGRRRRVRRREDGVGAALDWYEPELLALLLAIFALSGLDAAFTLSLVELGISAEANPLMDSLLASDAMLFVHVKLVVTAVAVVWMALCSRLVLFSRLRVRHVILGVLAVYGGLVGYQLVLMTLASRY